MQVQPLSNVKFATVFSSLGHLSLERSNYNVPVVNQILYLSLYYNAFSNMYYMLLGVLSSWLMCSSSKQSRQS